jgi:hypothetical protein
VSRQLWASALLASSLVVPSMANAATDAELADIRAQIKEMKETYEARIRALEERLKAAETAATSAPASSPVAAQASSSPSASTLAAFNPGIAVVLQGNYQYLKQDPALYAFNNIQLGDEVTPGRRGLGLAESEINLFASVDHLFAGNLTVSLAPDNSVSVEEAYGLVTALPYGLVPKFGRFFSGVGYMNEQHQHAWDFQDAPLAYQAFFGGQFTQDGAQLRWVAPTDTFVEFGAEVGNGDAFPGSPRNSNSAGAWSAFVHTGGDIGASSSWRAGVSYLDTRAVDRAGKLPDAAGNVAQTSFGGKTHTAIADFIWKYAPDGNATRTNFKVQGEYFWQRASGEPERLVPARRLAIHADVAGRCALRPLEPGYAGLRQQRAVSRDRSVQSAASDGDARLDSVGIQPDPAPIRPEQGTPRFYRQPIFSPVHLDAWRARRAQVLKEWTTCASIGSDGSPWHSR